MNISMSINPGLLSLLVLAAIHLFANRPKLTGWIWHGKFLSAAAGISFAYVFVDLLPALEKGQPVLKRTFGDLIPYLDKHAYVIALLGVLFFYGLQLRSLGRNENFMVTLGGYLLFNLFVGASLSDSTNPEIQPLALFTIAMGMHYFVNDHNVDIRDRSFYKIKASWWLVIFLFAGYIVGRITQIPDSFMAVAVSFLAGGVILNVLHYELPKREAVGYGFFVLGALVYTAIILRLGEK